MSHQSAQIESWLEALNLPIMDFEPLTDMQANIMLSRPLLPEEIRMMDGLNLTATPNAFLLGVYTITFTPSEDGEL
jgi:hypothetical protein